MEKANIGQSASNRFSRMHCRKRLVKKDLQGMGLAWEEAEVAALNRQEWRRSVVEYVHVDVG